MSAPIPLTIALATPTIALLDSHSAEGLYGIHTSRLRVQASEAPQLIDLTERIGVAVKASRVAAGQVTLFCMHTTASLLLNEDEALLHQDMKDFLERLSSSTEGYRHDDLSRRTDDVEPDHGRNAHAHLKQMVLGCSLVIPVLRGRLGLGTWQHVFLLELDRSRPRTVVVQVAGITGSSVPEE